MPEKLKTGNRGLETCLSGRQAVNRNLALLALLLTGLRLTGYITCSWLWVLAPLWLPMAIFAAVFTLLLTIKILHK
jgi:hypothetical protein